MAQNIQTSQDITDYDDAGIQTVNRPIILSWSYTGTGVIPKLISVQVEVEINGSFVNAGSEQIVTRTQTTAANNPSFEIDVSSLLKGFIEDNFTNALRTHSSASVLSSTHTSVNSQKNIIRYRASASSWYINTNDVLVQNVDDSPVLNPPSGSLYACNMYIKDEAFINSRYSNLGFSASTTRKATAFSVEGSSTSDLEGKTFLTNCPESLNRVLPIGSEFFVSVFNRSSIQLTLRSFINNDLGNLTETIVGSTMAANSNDIFSYNLTMSSPKFFSELTGTTPGACGEKLKLVLKNSNTVTKALNFKLVNGIGGTNPNLDSFPAHGSHIVFINDYNVYDYYFFEGFTDIVHEQQKYLYKTGFKDYTKRESSKRGVASAKTTEIYTCYTIVNEEASDWLSEIYRSTKVFLYNPTKSIYTPVIVLDQDIQVKYANKIEVKPFSISFIKDVHVINK